MSLQNQTFKDFEWIIVDDCSDDLNKALFENKKRCRLSVFIISNPINYKQANLKI